MALEGPLTQPRSFHSQSNTVHHYGRSQNEQAHWSTYSFVQLTVSRLPIGTTTLEIFNNFQRHGNVSKIIIYDRRQDDWSTRAEVHFEPPPQYPIWERGKVNFTSSNGYVKYVYLKLSQSQPKSFKVESPVHRGVQYNEKTELLSSSLTWGVLTAPETMMTMATTHQIDQHVRIVLNLRKREIGFLFPFVFRSDRNVAVRWFRFSLALDETFTIWRLPGKRYVFHLTSIPWYSKQLKEAVAQTHNVDAKRWSEEDTWARQTDVFEHKNSFDVIRQSPVSLQKNLNSINIARWTTFQITLLETEENKDAERVFRNALRDFNVHIRNGINFKLIAGGPDLDANAWTIINGKKDNSRPLSFIEELSALHLPFSVRYQLEVCLSQGWLSEYQITSEFLQKLSSMEEQEARQILIFVDSYQQRIWNPLEIFGDLRYRRPIKVRPLPEHCSEIRSAVVTATSIIWNSPTSEITNRVIRRYKNYADHFLRVRFEDDMYRGQSRLYASPNNKMILVFQRIMRTMLKGIQLGDRHYKFLAWGNSQLREHGVYFFAGTENVTVDDIRADMGVFDGEKVVAKRAARMGQCFSTTKPINLILPPITRKNTIPDIQIGKYTFTDGVGKISTFAAKIIQGQLNIRDRTPSAFQFRLGGCKGVLTVWPDLVGKNIEVRASQFKFDSASTDLEIIRCSEYWQPFLNRQIILCLSDLGVPTETFLKKQNDAIQAIEAAMKDNDAAVRALRDNTDPNMMTITMVNLINARFRSCNEPFVLSLLQLWKAWSLKYLKEKAKIPVPQGAFLLGCVDETNTLRGHFDNLAPHPEANIEEKTKTLPEIFVKITDPQTGESRVIESVCILARNPSLHRGDIRVVKAINVPALNHLCDVIVMPANGDRDLPSMCSGGDLDGDDYMVIWDQELIPEVWNAEPFHYDPPAPKTVTGEIVNEDIINFFYDYLQNDYLGRIAHAHLAAADYLDDGLQSNTCLQLVQLHSMAVDYPKTGVPAIMERRLERTMWPHFMEKRGSSYKSHKVLGKLYDAVQRVSFTPVHELPFDKRILNAYQSTETMLESVRDLKQHYDSALQRLMAQHKIKTEFEVWSTFVLNHSKASRDFKFHEEIGNLSATLKQEHHEALCVLAGGKDFEHLAPVAVAAYQYTNAMVQTALKEVEQGLREEGSDGMPFISFPWLLQSTLCKIAQQADDLVIDPGSTVVIEGGKFVNVENATEFDEKGRAQIILQNPAELIIRQPMNFSGHLPDPYQPEHDDVKGMSYTAEKLSQFTDVSKSPSTDEKSNTMTHVESTKEDDETARKDRDSRILGSAQDEGRLDEVESSPNVDQKQSLTPRVATHDEESSSKPVSNTTASTEQDPESVTELADPLDDPLNMTDEQLKDLGLFDDTEL